MKTILSFVITIFLFTTLCAQTYDISQYQARYERRPFLELNPRLNYASFFSNRDNDDQYAGGASITANWRVQSNMDDRIRNWSLFSQASFARRVYEDNDRPDESNRGVSLTAGLEQYNYRVGNKFWGFRGNAFISAQDRDDIFGESDRTTRLAIRPGVFVGSGRIEFSEDALLANWMLDDLLEAGVVNSATPEQRLALAQRITSTIGNRTFDFRRRRIYELQQLQQLFAESNIAVEDDFLLFAVLNDNWAFANRATLPNGQRWQVGLDAGGEYFYESMPVANDNFRAFARPYVNFQSAQIRHNNASTIWEAEVAGFYQDNLDEGNQFVPIFSLRSRSGATLNLNHTYVWLPISRTTLQWRNGVNVLFENFTPDDDIFTEDQWTVQAESVLSWDYFVSYNWRFSLNAGLRYFLNDNQFIENRTFQPFFNLSTNYAIF